MTTMMRAHVCPSLCGRQQSCSDPRCGSPQLRCPPPPCLLGHIDTAACRTARRLCEVTQKCTRCKTYMRQQQMLCSRTRNKLSAGSVQDAWARPAGGPEGASWSVQCSEIREALRTIAGLYLRADVPGIREVIDTYHLADILTKYLLTQYKKSATLSGLGLQLSQAFVVDALSGKSAGASACAGVAAGGTGERVRRRNSLGAWRDNSQGLARHSEGAMRAHGVVAEADVSACVGDGSDPHATLDCIAHKVLSEGNGEAGSSLHNGLAGNGTHGGDAAPQSSPKRNGANTALNSHATAVLLSGDGQQEANSAKGAEREGKGMLSGTSLRRFGARTILLYLMQARPSVVPSAAYLCDIQGQHWRSTRYSDFPPVMRQ
jgi:hypothetical protein